MKQALFRAGRRKICTVAIAMVILTVASLVSMALAKADAPLSPPFAPGERLVFNLRWSAVPAGQAVLEVMPMQVINGQSAYHFRLTAESNAFVDLFYKVRDRIDAYVSEDMRHSVHYRKKQHEGSTRRNVSVRFDWHNRQALHTTDDSKKVKSVKLIPGAFDPLSVFYFARTQPFKVNGSIQSPVTDGKKCVHGIGRIIKRERITIFSGTYDTFLIEPDLKHIGGVFEKEKDAKIKLWVTADGRRIPVKIASKVAVGSFIGELASIENNLRASSR